jgi:hypothetical protein
MTDRHIKTFSSFGILAPAMQPVASMACFETKKSVTYYNILLCTKSMLASLATSF